MEFHGKFSCKNPSNIYEKFCGIPQNFPWNSMEFHETEVDGIPWNFMKFSFDRI
jgi:hypothetical protein